MNAKDILDSPDNKRGTKFDPTWHYILVNEKDGAYFTFEEQGYKTLVKDVHDRLGRDSGFRLMGRAPS